MISKLQKIYYQEMCLTDAQERADDDSNEDELTDTGQNKAVKDLEVGHIGVMIILWAKVWIICQYCIHLIIIVPLDTVDSQDPWEVNNFGNGQKSIFCKNVSKSLF